MAEGRLPNRQIATRLRTIDMQLLIAWIKIARNKSPVGYITGAMTLDWGEGLTNCLMFQKKVDRMDVQQSSHRLPFFIFNQLTNEEKYIIYIYRMIEILVGSSVLKLLVND